MTAVIAGPFSICVTPPLTVFRALIFMAPAPPFAMIASVAFTRTTSGLTTEGRQIAFRTTAKVGDGSLKGHVLRRVFFPPLQMHDASFLCVDDQSRPDVLGRPPCLGVYPRRELMP